jgi:hypothetical protein
MVSECFAGVVGVSTMGDTPNLHSVGKLEKHCSRVMTWDCSTTLTPISGGSPITLS